MSTRIIRDADLDNVIAEMRQMLGEGIQSSSVRRLAEQAVSGKTNYIAAVFDFVRDTFPYVEDPYGFERFINPNKVAEDYFQGQIRGLDCDCHSLLTASCCGSIGYRVRIAILAVRSYEFDHATAQVYYDNDWVNLDTSNKIVPLGWIETYHRAVFVSI